MDSEMFHKIGKCRVCGNTELTTVLDLGNQYLSGIFPKEVDKGMYQGPLKLVKCVDGIELDPTTTSCGHVQLEHTFDLPTMYGNDYGYRSGLNSSMVKHLKGKYEKITEFLELKEKDIVVDIAGNDGTFLSFFPENLRLTSIDPTSEKFSKYFPEHVNYIADFFSKRTYRSLYGRNAKLITSFSMFYDLEDPCEFARQVRSCLDPDDGVWVLEQSYMPEMLRVNSFDTVCHEHLSYYGMRQLKYIMDEAGLKIIQYEFNDVNGGSISMMVCSKDSGKYEECTDMLNELIQEEYDLGLDTTKPWEDFEKRIDKCKTQFKKILKEFKDQNLKVAGLGASTKGNVTLQTWGIKPKDIHAIGDVNPDKDGSFTPGTWIPIQNEDQVLEDYDVFVILPWHFKKFFVNNPKFKGKTLVFPLPTPEVVSL